MNVASLLARRAQGMASGMAVMLAGVYHEYAFKTDPEARARRALELVVRAEKQHRRLAQEIAALRLAVEGDVAAVSGREVAPQ